MLQIKLINPHRPICIPAFKKKEEYFFWTNPIPKGLLEKASVKQRVFIQLIFRILFLFFKNVKIEVDQLLLEVIQLRENYIHTRAAQNYIRFGARGEHTNYVHF